MNTLEPKNVWKNFRELNAIPRASKKEEKAVAFVIGKAKELGLEYIQDKIGNVIIKKAGQGLGKDKAPVILQAHLDMVHQKNSDTEFDFDTQGIDMYIDNGWLKAKGTTLGADNGIGVAYILALLEDKETDLPPLEALFTIDEEAGMTGAKNLGEGLLQGKVLINIDTEDEKEISIGCAGGIDTTGTGEYSPEACPGNSQGYHIKVRGLKGGHSGMDIHLGRGNANKIMNRLLWEADENYGLRVSSIEGGGLRNAIPRESFVSVAVDSSRSAAFEKHVQEIANEIKQELKATEPGLEIQLEKSANPAQVIPAAAQTKLIQAIYTMPNGVYRMSDAVSGLVETSNNLARVTVKDGKINMQTLQRSSVESAKRDIAHAVKSAMNLAGLQAEHSGDYPGWAPDKDSELLKKTVSVYKKVMQQEPQVMACHAGLECGIIQSHYPGLDMVSIGPNIRHPHSPDEKVEIQSVEKVWNLLKKLLVGG